MSIRNWKPALNRSPLKIEFEERLFDCVNRRKYLTASATTFFTTSLIVAVAQIRAFPRASFEAINGVGLVLWGCPFRG
jgi:hypothetical protein